MRLAILIPAYNEEKTISQVIRGLPKKLPGVDKIEVVVVDDGSSDQTARLAKSAGATVLRHKINLGVGNAYKTALRYALYKFDIVITMDADGQHSPTDIKKIIKPILDKKADVVIGSRLIKAKGMPYIKIIGNWIMNFITYLFSGIWVTDSQSGFRAFNPRFLKLVRLKTSGYEVCIEMFADIKKYDLKLVEVPIKVIYHKFRSGQSIANTANIITNLLKRNLR